MLINKQCASVPVVEDYKAKEAWLLRPRGPQSTCGMGSPEEGGLPRELILRVPVGEPAWLLSVRFCPEPPGEDSL